jgi:integrase
MINRRNYRDVQEHLEYRRTVHQDEESTLTTRYSALKHLLLWADERLLGEGPEIRPPYPKYVADRGLAYTTQRGVVGHARTFYQWAVMACPHRYRISPLWLDALQAIKPARTERRPRELYTLEDVRALLDAGGDSLRDERTRAAVAMLFLSGMRDGAFVTLPIRAVDVGSREIRQWTAYGVLTKFGKTDTTYLLDIPDLLDVVRAWDARVRGALPPDAMWYANLSRAPGRKHVVATLTQSRGRARSLRMGLRDLCEDAGVGYLPPHKLRHGHIVHGLQNARSPADWKAVSQNVMHESMATTDAIYGDLLGDDVRERIGRLGRGAGAADVVAELEALLARLRGE